MTEPVQQHYSWLALVLLVLALASPALAQEDDGAATYAYEIHSASPPVSSVGGTPPEYDNVRVTRALQGPEVTLLWAEDEEQTLDNAEFARHQDVMGLLMEEWALDRPAAQDTGWSSLGRAIQYDAFSADLRRGDDDRTIAGQPTRHYIFEAELVKRVGGNVQKQRFDVTTDVWVLKNRDFSWAPFSVFGTQSLNADPRLRVALAERLADLGLPVRAETNLSFKILEGDSLVGGSESRQAVWIENLRTAEPPEVEIPVVDAAAARTLQAAIERNPQAMCEAVLEGDTPAFVQEALSAAQQTAFLEHVRPLCKREFGG